LDVKHQYGPEYITSFEVEMWGIWLALDCLEDEAVAAGVLICSDSQWALNALKESGHSAQSVLAPLRARLRGLKGCVCFQWVPPHCGLLGNERADEEARKAAEFGPAVGAYRGRISFEVVGGLQGASRREEVLLAQLRVVAPYYLGKPRKGSKGRTLCVQIVGRRRRTWSTS
jgi:hypothetical protein